MKTSIAAQPLLILSSGSEVPVVPEITPFLVPFETQSDIESSLCSTAELYIIPNTASVMTVWDQENIHFASVPMVWNWELSQEYQELGQALSEMKELAEDDQWRIDNDVYEAARYVAAGLIANDYPAPRLFNHGPKSVVFNWSREGDNLYLTISADQVSALLSSPERIKRRVDLSLRDFVSPSRDVPLITAYSHITAYSDIPVKALLTGTISDPVGIESF